ncbi:hypothetical protein HU200_014554 [Digitaria exilis]|uniref:Uncharacterized protein n=1 Tax=Digitaria exilis TaxID=1010633 RepID=A0A835FAW7_9POAL|nr:hypothetical protein HU200_014554 [Digitaria exilis]
MRAWASCKNCTGPRRRGTPPRLAVVGSWEGDAPPSHQRPAATCARASSSSAAAATRAPASDRHSAPAASQQHHQHRLVEPPHRTCREAHAHATAWEREWPRLLISCSFASHHFRRKLRHHGAAGRPVQEARRCHDEGGEQQRLAAGELHFCSIDDR